MVLDWGCGSGRKMVRHFAKFAMIGVEVAENIRRLESQFPHHIFGVPTSWMLRDLKPGVLLCADVIEHVEDPTVFMRELLKTQPKWIVLSTPSRDHIRGGSLTGPPTNPCHAREWTMPEFAAFIGQFVDIVEHTLIDPERATQCIVARPRP